MSPAELDDSIGDLRKRAQKPVSMNFEMNTQAARNESMIQRGQREEFLKRFN